MDIHEMNFHCFITFMKYLLLASIYCFEAFEVNLPAVKWFGSWLISYLCPADTI
jgi:hypothetical protein